MTGREKKERHAEELLDETVEESFPASDPPARSIVADIQEEVEDKREQDKGAQPRKPAGKPGRRGRHTYPRR